MLGRYLAGTFDNRAQAIANPAWFVHLQLWHRPISLFQEDSVALFAEQANVYTPENPYRQRILRIHALTDSPNAIQVQYYGFKNPETVKGAGRDPEKLVGLTIDQLDRLPGCILQVEQQGAEPNQRFVATPPIGAKCCFQYAGETRQVVLGFEVTEHTFFSYDKGVDSEGKALWGATMGAYEFNKREQF